MNSMSTNPGLGDFATEAAQPANTKNAPSPSPHNTPAIHFPDSAFVGLGGDFVKLYSPLLESPPEFLFAAWHACFGTVISPYVRMNLATDLTPRLYVVALGSSAVPRKSTAIKVALRLWELPDAWTPSANGKEAWNTLFRTEYSLGSVEGFARVFNGWAKKGPSAAQADTRPTLVAFDELRTLVAKATQKGSTLLPFLTQMFESEEYDNTTVGRRISVRGCHIGLLAACTTDTFSDMWSSEFAAIGFHNRLFLIDGEPRHRRALPKRPPEAHVAALQQRMFSLVEKIRTRHESGGRISMTTDAEKRWVEYYETAMSQSVHSKRLDTYALKWMMLLALSQEEFEITPVVVDEAIKLIEYQLHVRKLYDPIDADNAHAKMEEKIRRVLSTNAPRALTRTELTQKTNAHRSGLWLFDMALNNLLKSQEIKQAGTGKRYAWAGEEHQGNQRAA